MCCDEPCYFHNCYELFRYLGGVVFRILPLLEIYSAFDKFQLILVCVSFVCMSKN